MLLKNSLAFHVLLYRNSGLGKFERKVPLRRGTLPAQTVQQTKMNTQTIKALSKEALKPRSKKQVKMVREPVTLADGSAFTPVEVKTNSDALRATLLMLFKHVADVHVTLVEIVADKFHLNVDDIHSAITEDPRWQNMLVDPLVTDLTAAAKEKSVPPPSPPKTTNKKPAILIADEPELVFD